MIGHPQTNLKKPTKLMSNFLGCLSPPELVISIFGEGMVDNCVDKIKKHVHLSRTIKTHIVRTSSANIAVQSKNVHHYDFCAN